MKLHQSSSRSFALEQFDPANPGELGQTVFFYRTGSRIEVFDGDIEAFVRELTQRWDSTPKTTAPERRVAPNTTNGASVFISYAHEDKERAVWLYDGLRRAGLDAWMDKDLEIGTKWDPAIESFINEKDYFLIVVSKALQAKNFSFVYDEIAVALRRQRSARQGITYILPVCIDDSTPLPELAPFQAVRVSNDNDLGKVVSHITRDLQLRARVKP